MSKNKRKTEKIAFTHLVIPAEVLRIRKFSMVEKLLVSDIGYFTGGGNDYRFNNCQIAEKFGVSRRAVFNSIKRLKSAGGIVVTGDEYHRNLRLNGELAPLFEKKGKDTKTALSEPSKRFQKPTAEEVTEYAASISFELDGEQFVNYYEARGWLIGKNKMKDWKAAVRTWKTRQKNGNSSKSRERSETVGAFIR